MPQLFRYWSSHGGVKTRSYREPMKSLAQYQYTIRTNVVASGRRRKPKVNHCIRPFVRYCRWGTHYINDGIVCVYSTNHYIPWFHYISHGVVCAYNINHSIVCFYSTNHFIVWFHNTIVSLVRTVSTTASFSFLLHPRLRQT